MDIFAQVQLLDRQIERALADIDRPGGGTAGDWLHVTRLMEERDALLSRVQTATILQFVRR